MNVFAHTLGQKRVQFQSAAIHRPKEKFFKVCRNLSNDICKYSSRHRISYDIISIDNYRHYQSLFYVLSSVQFKRRFYRYESGGY
jgi:hypothetical protein